MRPEAELSFTGERFVPQCSGEIAYEHWHRYAFAQRLVSGKRVLDAACGEGYGGALLARVAREVQGIDIAAEAIAHARNAYAKQENLRFTCGSCTALPFADASFDVIVSFETVEHIDAAAQRAMLAEFHRVLAPGGVILMSSPNKATYSDARNYRNEFHVCELYRDEFSALVRTQFPALRWYGQSVQWWSAVWAEAPTSPTLEAWELKDQAVNDYRPAEPIYFLVAAAAETAHLPDTPQLSLLTDAESSMASNYEHALGEVLRLDALLGQRDRELHAATERILAQEHLSAERERLIVERDAWLAERQVHIAHLERLIAEREAIITAKQTQLDRQAAEYGRLLAERLELMSAQEDELRRQHALIVEREGVIAYRQRWKWWLQLPWFRFRLWSQRH